MGYAVDGGLAEYMLVPADAVEAGCLFPAHVDLPPSSWPSPSRWAVWSMASASRRSRSTTSC
jgi:hypothetical protein